MDTILTFETAYNEKVEILFSDNSLQISVFSEMPEVYTFNYSDIDIFYTKEYSEKTEVVFYSKDKKISRLTTDKQDYTTNIALRLKNPENKINFSRIFEDRTPLRSKNRVYTERLKNFNNKWNSSTQGYGEIRIQMSRLKYCEIFVDGISVTNTYKLPYIDGYRIFQIPFNNWSIAVGSSDNEQPWKSNILIAKPSPNSPIVCLCLQNKMFKPAELFFL
jgi:hypothetical protein